MKEEKEKITGFSSIATKGRFGSKTNFLAPERSRLAFSKAVPGRFVEDGGREREGKNGLSAFLALSLSSILAFPSSLLLLSKVPKEI